MTPSKFPSFVVSVRSTRLCKQTNKSTNQSINQSINHTDQWISQSVRHAVCGWVIVILLVIMTLFHLFTPRFDWLLDCLCYYSDWPDLFLLIWFWDTKSKQLQVISQKSDVRSHELWLTSNAIHQSFLISHEAKNEWMREQMKQMDK